MVGAGMMGRRSTLSAPYFLKVYGLRRPEVHGHALKCLRLDIQPRRCRLTRR